MPKSETKSKAAPEDVAAEKRKPLDKMTKKEMIKADIYNDIIGDYFPNG